MNNAAQKVTRIDKDAWEIATELANEYGVSICHIISESVRSWVVLIAQLMRIRFLLSRSLDKLRLTLKTTSTLVAMTCYRRSLRKLLLLTG